MAFPFSYLNGRLHPQILSFKSSHDCLGRCGSICSPVSFSIPHLKIAQLTSKISINTSQCGHSTNMIHSKKIVLNPKWMDV